MSKSVRLKEDQQLAIALRKQMEHWLNNNTTLVSQLIESKKTQLN